MAILIPPPKAVEAMPDLTTAFIPAEKEVEPRFKKK